MSDDALIHAVSAPCLLGESPFWHPQEACLYWCDIDGRAVHRLDPDSGASRAWGFDTEPGCCAPLLGGGLLVALRDGLWRLDTGLGRRHRVCAAPYDPACERFNDGKCDPQGRFWAGTLYEPRTPPRAALYCYDGERMVPRADGVATANGLAWSPDGRTLYWADTRGHAVLAFDFDPVDGALSRRRTFARFAPRQADAPLAGYGGRPDGAAVDQEGCYWVAMYEGARLVRLGPDGTLRSSLALPVQCPTMPCFGGPDLRTLYVTTARAHRPAAELAAQPLAGCVLSMRVEVPGLPVNFALL